VFTPLMMGFTSIDSYIIRGTGLVIAMATGLMASRRFLGRGLANIKIVLFAGVPYAGFAVLGALMAGYLRETLGEVGEAAIRVCLGAIVIIVASWMLFGGKNTQYPVVRNVDSFSKKLGLAMAYWEESIGKIVDYKVSRAPVSILLFCFVGFVSGVFGLGAGWAVVPALNLVMLAPLKVAAASSSVLISVGDTAAVWQYVKGGAIFAPFVVPCLIGIMLGAIIGSRIMVKINAGFVRWVVIAIMFGSGIKLLLDGAIRLVHL
jgi:uncharacterized membrane protein YfcA